MHTIIILVPSNLCRVFQEFVQNSKSKQIQWVDQCYSRVQKSIENFYIRPKMTIFRRAGMREGGLPLPLAFEYLILVI